jgi:uncharacterized protein involved in exopolysaccharide biosynthesis
VTLRDIKGVLRRRRRLLIVPPVVVFAICLAGLFLLPRKYESSTTIWVQRDEVLNPLVSFSMAVQMASEDRLRTFNEIVMSRQTMEMLIDSLHLADAYVSPVARDDLVEQTRSQIRTDRRGSDSFSITFTDTDPQRARRAVALLADYFISTRLQAERTRNDYTVSFFDQKLREYQEKFDETEKNVVSLLRKRMQELPTATSSLTSRLDFVEGRIRDLEDKIRSYRRARINLDLFPAEFGTERGRQLLAELQRSELPNSGELKTLLSQYDSVTVRYTSRYPEVGKLEARILEFLKRSREIAESEIQALESQIDDERRRRSMTVDEMMASTVAQREDQDKESNYSLYKKLYEEMKVKLEQARIAQELGRHAQNQFIIIDPARVPAKPSKPNRPLILLGGLFLGVALGVISALTGEFLDTTVHSRRQLDVYRKPVIAILPAHIQTQQPRGRT